MASKDEILRVTPLRNPLLSAITLVKMAASSVFSLVHFVLHHKLTVGLTMIAIAIFGRFMIEPSAELMPTRDLIAEHGSFTLYWVILGVLSSVGLGSGLHTFVLYLGPHILRVASTAVTHQTTDFTARIEHYFAWPHSWSNTTEVVHAFTPQYYEDAWTPVHSDAPRSEPTFFAILMKVAWPAFLWGAGTALGELPPYFVARAARRAGEALEELEEVQTISASASASGEKKLSLVDRAKRGVTAAVERYGFIAVFLAASIPNPLFDLAGLTCGHIGVPFLTFFSATFLGKAIVKVGLQTLAIIIAVTFGPSLLRLFASFADSMGEGSPLKPYLHKAQTLLINNLQNSCKSDKAPLAECLVCCDRTFDGYAPEIVRGCHTSCAAAATGAEAGAPQPWYKELFGYFILAMILYFVYSMVTSLVQERLVHDLTRAKQQEAEEKGEAAAQQALATSGSPSTTASDVHASTGSDKPRSTSTGSSSSSSGSGSSGKHMTHVHGAQLISALVNADDLLPGTPAVASAAPVSAPSGASAAGSAAGAKGSKKQPEEKKGKTTPRKAVATGSAAAPAPAASAALSNPRVAQSLAINAPQAAVTSGAEGVGSKQQAHHAEAGWEVASPKRRSKR